MNANPQSSGPWRMGVVWLHGSMIAQGCLDGIWRRAKQHPDVTLRAFDVMHPDFGLRELSRLKDWRPHGVVARLYDPEILRQLRSSLPGIPIVSASFALPECVDTCVVIDRANLLEMARDHFQKCGVPHIALFYCGEEQTPASRGDPFHTLVPDGLTLRIPPGWILGHSAHRPAEKNRLDQRMREGLRGLPKPVGIVTTDAEMGPYLLEWCQELGLSVPEEVQIIGMDDEDRCLAYDPPLTAFQLPNEAIGEAALEAVLRHLDPTQPKPPPILRISAGSRLVVRGSTMSIPAAARAVTGALAYMQTHPHDGLTTTQLAQASGSGRASFYKQFAAATGSTPARLRRQQRLEQACRLLRETPDTATAIAAACGFPSLIAFVQFFRRQTGLTPTAWRKSKPGYAARTARANVNSDQ
jgi:LacI family transcriptional regulator